MPSWINRVSLGYGSPSGVASSRRSAIEELPTTYSSQEDFDTKVVLCLHHATILGYKNAVVRAPDTGIFVFLLYHAQTIKLTVYLDTESGKQLVNLFDLAVSLCQSYCVGEDCTNAFKCKGKLGP